MRSPCFLKLLPHAHIQRFSLWIACLQHVLPARGHFIHSFALPTPFCPDTAGYHSSFILKASRSPDTSPFLYLMTRSLLPQFPCLCNLLSSILPRCPNHCNLLSRMMSAMNQAMPNLLASDLEVILCSHCWKSW